ncbi:putative E3 ubiquitin-protein ligase HERC1-like [Capsicum annuum]|nr:putative E3 ubiquitin-protein ligase HERC1-like [Capsicum annuum]
MGLSDCSSVDSCNISTSTEDNNGVGLNLKATEHRPGLPRSQSPKRVIESCPLGSTKIDEKLLFPLHPAKDTAFSVSQKIVLTGNKRGFLDAMDGFLEVNNHVNTRDADFLLKVVTEVTKSILQGKFLSNSGVKACDTKETSRVQPPKLKNANTQDTVLEKPSAVNKASNCEGSRAPATKAQVMGWPPIRSVRTNTITSALKNNEEIDGKAGSPALFIKVSMDGAPYLRKVNLRNHSAYQELSSADFVLQLLTKKRKEEPEICTVASLKRLFVESRPYLLGSHSQHNQFSSTFVKDHPSMPEKYNYMTETFQKTLAFVRVHAYDKESYTLLVSSMMSSQFVQKPESLSKYFAINDGTWLGEHDGANISFHELNHRFGKYDAFEKFGHKFESEEKWKENRAFSFVVGLLGTMVFPKGESGTINPRVIMVADTLFNRMDYDQTKVFQNLAPMILAEIYRALGMYQSGALFFQGCNIIDVRCIYAF